MGAWPGIGLCLAAKGRLKERERKRERLREKKRWGILASWHLTQPPGPAGIDPCDVATGDIPIGLFAARNDRIAGGYLLTSKAMALGQHISPKTEG